MTDLHFQTIAQASAQIKSRALSPVELTKAFLTRVKQLDGRLNTHLLVLEEQALADAKKAESEIAAGNWKGPLHGIPIGLKDIYNTAGIRTTGHSALFQDHVPTEDAFTVGLLRDAGAIITSKLATWEFAIGGSSFDLPWPPARNPWDVSLDPSGSSSGSGAAVAAGFSPATLGSDTGGSIRGPAAANGIAGLKPTYGLVSRRGVIPNCFSHDHAGPLAWTTEDVAILMQVIAGHDPEDPGSVNVAIPDYRAALTGSVKGLVIGVPWGWFEQLPLSPATMKAFEDSLSVFKTMGAEIRPVTLPPLRDYEYAKKVIAVAELFTIHAHDLRTRPELFGDSLRYRIIAGGLVRAEDYILAMRQRTDLARAMQAVMATVDVMMLPTQEPAGKLEPVAPETLFTKLSFTTAFNVGGNPALSICNGYAENGLPFSLQIVGKLFDDATVLRVGDAYEKATPWRDRRPELKAA